MRKIGFIGFGKIAKAIASGILKQAQYEICFYDVIPDAISGFEGKVIQAESQEILERECDIVIFSVKPKDIKKVVSECRGDKIYITVAAGVPLKKYYEWNPKIQKIVRVMPNLGALVSSSVSAIYSNDSSLFEITDSIFRTIGITIPIYDENLMHAITALSGSGPAYVFLMIQSMIEAGIREGLSYEVAYQASLYTVLGTARTLQENPKIHPADLIRQVASPGGTTIEGLATLEKHNFRFALLDAIHQATEKSKQLGS